MRVEALRGAVDRRGEPGRAGADDDQVAGRLGAPRDAAARPAGPARRWSGCAAPSSPRQMTTGVSAGATPSAAQQRLGLRSSSRSIQLVGQAVAGGELAQPPRVGRVARADDPEAGAEADQDRAADEVGAQDQVAERRVLGDELAQPLGGDREHLAGLATTAVRNAAWPVSRLSSPRKRPGPWTAISRSSPRSCLDDRDLALQDDEEVVARVALAEQDLARGRRTTRPSAPGARSALG